MLIALAFGVTAGNLVGPAITGTDRVWDVSFVHGLDIIVGSLISLLIGTMLGILFRSSPVALVAYFVTSFMLPTVFGLLAPANQEGLPEKPATLGGPELRAVLPCSRAPCPGKQWARLAVATTPVAHPAGTTRPAPGDRDPRSSSRAGHGRLQPGSQQARRDTYTHHARHLCALSLWPQGR